MAINRIHNCPMCNGGAGGVQEDRKVTIKCENCGFQSPEAEIYEGALALWNALCEIIGERSIIDSDGYLWILADGRIRLVVAEVEATDPEELEENGHRAYTMVRAREELKRGGYLD